METAEEKMANAADQTAVEDPLVCRRVVLKGVVVAALHPIAGPVYWCFVDESDCNYPDYYGVTDDLDLATVFKSGYYHGRSFRSFESDCLDGLSEFDEDVKELAEKADTTPEKFTAWLYHATWVEYPAPVKIYFLRDFNGFIGYRPEWSENVGGALHWSREELADQDDPDVDLARSCGHFVPLSQAMVMKPVVRKASEVNHALEADCALTLDRLGVRNSRDWSQSESGIASWLGDWEETAWIHAARAGVEHVRDGEVRPVSRHIAAFPALLERFDMAVALARHEAMQLKLLENSCGQEPPALAGS